MTTLPSGPEWRSFKDRLTAVENHLVNMVRQNKFAYEDIMGLWVTQRVRDRERIWYVIIGETCLNFKLPAKQEYIYNGRIIDYDELAEAVRPAFRAGLYQQFNEHSFC